MFKTLIVLIVFVSKLNVAAYAATDNKTQAPELTFVLVHGATGGGWDWKEVAGYLEAEGHDVYRATLTGLGERTHLASDQVNLSTHINDVANLIRFEQLQNVVLVGHSYGGMVITGVANAMPDRLSHLIFLDAAAPDHGQSALDVWGGLGSEHKVKDGIVYFSWLEADAPAPKDVPHPLPSLQEKVAFDAPAAQSINATFVAFVPEGMSETQRAMDESWKRAGARGWTRRFFAGDHVIYRQKPKEMAALLVMSTKDRNNESKPD